MDDNTAKMQTTLCIMQGQNANFELKPCPFCGEQNLLEYEVIDHGEEKRPLGFRFTAKVTCLSCFGSCGTHGFHRDEDSSRRAAFRAWNRRADDGA